MKSTELRIGNWISLGNRIGYIQSNWSESQYIVIDKEETQDTIESIDRFKPIELTEEWLIKLGFEHSKSKDKFYTKESIYGISTADDKIMFITGNFVCQLILREIKYVHQLQNLYFALTNKELEYV